jgi:hypothetical protein
LHRVPLPRTTDSLKDRAQEILERVGYPDSPADAVWGWSNFSRIYLERADRRRTESDPWPDLATGRTGTAGFWYRTSPTLMFPSFAQMMPTETDPPLTLSDMRIVRLDAHGRLIEFQSLPQQVDANAVAGNTNWRPLFEGLV